MEKDPGKKTTRKAKKSTRSKAKPARGRAVSPPAASPPSEPPPDTPRAKPPVPPALHPAVALLVSLLAPGLGLLLLERKDRVKDAFLIFGLWFSYVAMAFFLTFFVIGLCCWLPLPLLNVAAGIHSFDEMTLEQGGRPVLFQTSFRILD